ncbi:MAG: STAS domain-containing protein [Desulfobacterales bacterium]|nr:STAS domain-containing protein [Desulfobacterales bacterium]
MKMHPETGVDNEVDGNLSLQVYISEKREGLFVLEPVGSINTITSRSLQKLVERICASKPHIIMFDLERVDFINSKGLRVILKVYRAINALGGRVVLVNFQPHIKEVFEIINALPEQRIFLRAGMRSTVIWKRCQSVKPILAAQRNPKRSS